MGNPDLQCPLLAHSVLQGPWRHLPWERRRKRDRGGGAGPVTRYSDFPGGKLQRIFLDNGRKFHLGFFKSFFGNKRWTPRVLFKLSWLNISLCPPWPLTSKPGDASAGTQSFPLHAGAAVHFQWGHLSWWLEPSKPPPGTGISWSSVFLRKPGHLCDPWQQALLTSSSPPIPLTLLRVFGSKRRGVKGGSRHRQREDYFYNIHSNFPSPTRATFRERAAPHSVPS